MNFSLKQTITKRRFKLNTLKKYVRWQKVQLQIAINNPIYTRNMFGKFIYIILFPVHLMVLFIYLWYVCILHAPILKTSFSKKKKKCYWCSLSASKRQTHLCNLYRCYCKNGIESFDFLGVNNVLFWIHIRLNFYICSILYACSLNVHTNENLIVPFWLHYSIFYRLQRML